MPAAPYISWTGHGAASGLPPGVFTDAVMHVFGIDVDGKATQTLVDQLLNAVPGTGVSYSAVGGMALITFMDIAKCTSGGEVVGWVPGRECAIWIPLFESHGLNVLEDRFVLWSPYILISYGIGMVTGREVWGWPKQLAVIDLPAGGTTPPG